MSKSKKPTITKVSRVVSQFEFNPKNIATRTSLPQNKKINKIQSTLNEKCFPFSTVKDMLDETTKTIEPTIKEHKKKNSQV